MIKFDKNIKFCGQGRPPYGAKFKILLLLVIIFLFGFFSHEMWFIKQSQKDPCYYEYIKNLQNDQNYSGRFVFCANRLMQNSEIELKYYFRHLPKEANFTSQEQIVVDKVKKILDNENLKGSK
ncbi:MAG: hypothetical protein J6M14_02560 [Campylobacter sp.]|nr:hypothetical protein [Campylobacter sp.]